MKIVALRRPRFRTLFVWSLAALVFMAFRDGSALQVFAPKLKPIYSVQTSKPEVAISFDISWGESNVTPVLDILKEANIRATFFLSGPWAKKNSALVKRMVAEGHEIGSHGNRHIDLNTLGKEAIKKEIMLAHADLQAVSGTSPKLIRTPNGAYDNTVIQAINELGYRAIQWSTDSLDWKKPGPEAIVNNVLKGHKAGQGAKPGSIILFHASDSAPETVTALPIVLVKLKDLGYSIMPVGELLQRGETTWPPESRTPAN